MRSWLLALLQLLLLLSVLLRQLLCLLLVLLFQLLLPRCIGGTLREPLMILILFCLEFRALTDLLYLKLLLLLLVLLVPFGIAGIWSGDLFRGRKIPGMRCWTWACSLCGWTSGLGVLTWRLGVRSSGLGARPCRLVARASVVVHGSGRGAMNCSAFSGSYSSAVSECSGLRGSSDGRLAVTRRGA